MLNFTLYHARSYISNLPRDIPEKAAKSALFTFALSSVINRNFEVAILRSAFAALASCISGLTIPIFHNLFADKYGSIAWHIHLLSDVGNLAVTDILVNTFSKYRVNLLANVPIGIVLSLYVNGFYNRSMDHASLYIFK